MPTVERSSANPESGRDEVTVRFAKPRAVVVSTLVGWGFGKLTGLGGLLGCLGGSGAYAAVEALSFFSAARFAKLRAARRRGTLQARAAVSRRVAVLSSALVNFTLSAAVLSALALLIGLISVNPEDVGLARGEVSSQRLYLTLAAFGFGIGTGIVALFWGTALDFAEGKLTRGILGIAALAAEFTAAALTRPYIAGSDNIYTDIFSVLLLWLVWFVWNPVRWARAYYFRADSRLLALVNDVIAAAPQTRYVRRKS